MKASNLIGAGQDRALTWRSQKAPVNEVRFPAYEAKNPSLDSSLYVKDSALRKAVDEFMTGKGSSNPRRVDETTKPARPRAAAKPKNKRNKPSSIKGLEQAQTEGENMAVIVESQGKLGFPFYFPALRKTGSRYADPKPRVYGIRDGQGKLHRAYRLVLYAGAYGEYYGVQGMSWRYPPILDDPDARATSNGRKLMLYYDGSHLRLVAWRTREGGLLGHEHADDVDPELAPDRDRGVAAAPEELALLRASGGCASRSRRRSSRACGCRRTRTRSRCRRRGRTSRSPCRGR